MKKARLAIALIAIIAAVLLFAVYAMTYSESLPKTEMTVYVDNPMEIDDFIKEIETHPYFKGYNSTTVGWLKTLDGGSVVLSNNDSYVIMSQADASKLHIESVTDVSITNTFDCHVKEKKPLGKDLKNITFVDGVDFKKQDIKYLDV